MSVSDEGVGGEGWGAVTRRREAMDVPAGPFLLPLLLLFAAPANGPLSSRRVRK